MIQATTAQPKGGTSGRPLVVVNILLALMVIGALWSRHLESIRFTGADPLQTTRFGYNAWKTVDVPISPQNYAQLSPDIAMIRNYFGPRGASLQFAVIGGHRKKSIHTPTFCMQGGGWEIISQNSTVLNVDGDRIPATQSTMLQDGHMILLTYYFTDGAYRSSSLVPFQFVQLMKRFRGGASVGALVRIIVPIATTTSAAQSLTTDFLSTSAPKVDNILRNMHLQPQ